MNDLILVDTSVFINFLRGDRESDISHLITDGRVLLSKIVEMELHAGSKRSDEKHLQTLFKATQHIPKLPEADLCLSLMSKVKGSGLFTGITDFLIIVDCIANNATLYSSDRAMNELANRLGVSLYNTRAQG